MCQTAGCNHCNHRPHRRVIESDEFISKETVPWSHWGDYRETFKVVPQVVSVQLVQISTITFGLIRGLYRTSYWDYKPTNITGGAPPCLGINTKNWIFHDKPTMLDTPLYGNPMEPHISFPQQKGVAHSQCIPRRSDPGNPPVIKWWTQVWHLPILQLRI